MRAGALSTVVATALMVASILWYVGARAALLRCQEQEDERALGLAQELLREELSVEATQVAARCAIVADDPRLKAALAMPDADPNTMHEAISDVLLHLDSVRDQDLAIVLAPDRRVIATWGDAQLFPTELRSSALIDRATSSSTGGSGRWAVSSGLLNIAARRIQLGSGADGSGGGQLLGLVVLGSRLRRSTSGQVLAGAGVFTRWVIGGQSLPGSEPLAEAVVSGARDLATGSRLDLVLDEGAFLAEAITIEAEGLPARMLLFRSRLESPWLSGLLIAPMAGAWLLGVALVLGPTMSRRGRAS